MRTPVIVGVLAVLVAGALALALPQAPDDTPPVPVIQLRTGSDGSDGEGSPDGTTPDTEPVPDVTGAPVPPAGEDPAVPPADQPADQLTGPSGAGPGADAPAAPPAVRQAPVPPPRPAPVPPAPAPPDDDDDDWDDDDDDRDDDGDDGDDDGADDD